METIRLESGGDEEYTWGRGKNLWISSTICNLQDYNPLILGGLTVAKAPHQNAFDGEGRRLGERTGLETPVVLAVNHADFGVPVT